MACYLSLSPFTASGCADGRIAYGTGAVAEVELYRVPDGTAGIKTWFRRPARSLRLPGARRPLTRDDRRAWERAQLAERSGSATSEAVAERFGAVIRETVPPDSWAAYDRLFFDSGGDLWVRRPPAIEATEAAWDVLRSDGTLRGTVTLPATLELHAIVNGTAYGVVKGEWDEDMLQGFSVRWD